MKSFFIFFIIFQLVTFDLIVFVLPAYSIGLDDEIEDQEDIEDYLQKARENANCGNFSDADSFLTKARKLGANKKQLDNTLTYISQKRQASRIKASQKVPKDNLAEHGSAPAPQVRPSSPEKQEGTLFVKVESGGILFSLELDRYVIKIKKTKNLDGNYAYGMEDKKTGSGSFWGDPATFYYKKFGYYEVECTGYNKYSKEVFRIKYGNIKHACSSTDITMYANGTQPYVYCPLGE